MKSNLKQLVEQARGFKNEDTLYHTKDDVIIGIDEDEKGKYVSSKDKKGDILKTYLEGDQFVFYRDGKEVNRIDVDHIIFLGKALEYLVDAVEKTKKEDGTASDLGLAPTKPRPNVVINREPEHSLDPGTGEDDGW